MQCERVGRPASLGATILALRLPMCQANALQVLYLFKSRYVMRVPVYRTRRENEGVADCRLRLAEAQAWLLSSQALLPARGRSLTVPGKVGEGKSGNEGSEWGRKGIVQAFRLENGHVTGTSQVPDTSI